MVFATIPDNENKGDVLGWNKSLIKLSLSWKRIFGGIPYTFSFSK